jgi:hypothetical protein
MATQAAPDVVISHWSTLIEGFQASPLSFFKSVEEALARREIPETKKSRVDYKEAGLLSANREYLRVQREKLVFDVCAAPFGTGFFVSYWLAEDRLKLNPLVKLLVIFGILGVSTFLLMSAGVVWGFFLLAIIVVGGMLGAQMAASTGDFDDEIIVALPLLGTLYLWLFRPATYYRIDSMTMFQKAVHNSVLEVIDAMTAEKGIRALSEADRKPTMREFYSRKAA